MDDSNREGVPAGETHGHAAGADAHSHEAGQACGHDHAHDAAHGCGHDHSHDAGHGCGHDHAHDHAQGGAHACGHDHSHDGHDHGAAHSCSGVCGDRPAEPQEVGPPPYELIGGDAGLRALVDRFYDLMDIDERFAELRAMHPVTLDRSRDKLHWFLTGWMGGPDLFSEKVGAPMLRARHLPFPIDVRARDQWLTCMAIAMADVGIVDPFYDRLLEGFCGTADWMRNQPG